MFLVNNQGFEGSYNDTQSYSCRQWCISYCLNINYLKLFYEIFTWASFLVIYLAICHYVFSEHSFFFPYGGVSLINQLVDCAVT